MYTEYKIQNHARNLDFFGGGGDTFINT